MEVKWNQNGNWLLTASRDHLCKLFDVRNLKEELQVFRGHKKEATGVLKGSVVKGNKKGATDMSRACAVRGISVLWRFWAGLGMYV